MISGPVRAFAVLLGVMLSVSCGDSVVGPTDEQGVRLGNMAMRAGWRAGANPMQTDYVLCGSITRSPDISAPLSLRKWEIIIYNADRSTLLTWTDDSRVGQQLGLGISGCFGGPTDPVPLRPSGVTYRFRLTYSGGGADAVEVSGPIDVRQ